VSIVSIDKDVEGLRFVLVAEFDAPIVQVWELWVDPRKLERWWGPPGYPATIDKHDLRPGGEVTYSMAGPGGETSRGWWRVTSVDPPRSLEFTDGFANEDGTPNSELPTHAVQVRLSEQEAGTRMELRFVFESREQMEQMEGLGAFEGIPQSVGQMDDVLVQT
jgi:uncharacterized protein YndB with AHSA1/START domain